MVAVAWTHAGLRRFSGPRPGRTIYLITAALYFTAYVAINYATALRQFGHSSITLWSPDNAISLLLLTELIAYTPVVLLASICVDVLINHASYGWASILASELVLTLGYLLIAILLRDLFQYDFRAATYPNVLALLAVVPASAVVTSAIYCGTLYLTGSLARSEIFTAVRYFWIGDTVGMIVTLPAATAIYDITRRRLWRRLLAGKPIAAILAVGSCLALLVLASVGNPRDRYLFDLLFLPTIWVGIGYGYSAVAILLLTTQLMLVGSLSFFQVANQDFAVFQTLMFILAATGQLLGAVVSERETTIRLLRKQQSDLARFSAHATSGALAATLAHEISQPLSSLASYVHGARRMLENQQPPDLVVGILTKAEAEARRTRDIIVRIRDFVSSGSLKTELADLRPLVLKIAALNRDEAQARGVELACDCPERAVLANVDQIAIEQALNNLVVNAVEAAGAKGKVVIRLANYDARATLQVDDDGPGVASDIAAKLFDVFETTKPDGMGLGLALARQIAEKHGGQLTWRPRQPRGASFTIELPIHEHENSADQA